MKQYLSAILLLLLCFQMSVYARKVTGKVTCGNKGIQGVTVTDGHGFATTGRNGSYTLDLSDAADFVYIITPSGYAADWSSGTPAFYLPVSGSKRYDFDLKKTGNGSDNYSIIAIADPQMANEGHYKKFSKQPIEDLCATAKELSSKELTVGLALGDIGWDAFAIAELYKGKITDTGIPFYPVIGNHDHAKDLQGDYETSSVYREMFGPENYAFLIGKDAVIVLDNIIYNTAKDYKEGCTESTLEWVKGLLKHLPADASLYVAQHSPVYGWFIDSYAKRGEELIGLFEGRDVTFLSGHTHINNNLKYSDTVKEYNVAAFCGSWWVTKHCNDGTPRGYKVISKRDGQLSRYYKSIDYDKDFQMEIFKPGECPLHPNSVVANIWDFDSDWETEWFEDGVSKGQMEQVIDYSPLYIKEINAVYADKGKKTPEYKLPRKNYHYFTATPGQYSKKVDIVVRNGEGSEWKYSVDLRDYVDAQAHRGGAGLMPENTIQSMQNALDLGVNTLELDLQISADGKVVVSHDAYFHPRYATRPDGSIVKPEDPREYIYTMPYDSVKKYDTGLRESTVWPEKACVAAYKPLADELLDFTENYTKENGMSPVRYNIEIKSKSGKGEGTNWPEYHEFVDKCVELLKSKDLGDRLVVQCFDVRALNYMHEKYPDLILSYLVDNKAGAFEDYMALLDFTPTWLSPHFSMVDEELCRKCAEKGIKLVPWTVDKPEDIQRMIDLKVEAIISNYPDRLLKATRGFASPMPESK
ncbi:MAG: glycerophosphodiester phosphodiesterase family protein [Candidatus Cryptobacteroides sp.]